MAETGKKDVLRETDAEARRLAGDLIRSARFGALAVLDPATGIPLASRVSVATDLAGHPLILISQLSAHFGALEADPRCSILLGEPGRGDPLAHARITVTAEARKLAGDDRGPARARFLARHPKAALYADFGDFAFWQLEVTGASLNGGFGKAYALDAVDLVAVVPEGLAEMEPGVVEHMNDDHAQAVKDYAAAAGLEALEWRMTGLDAQGLDLAASDATARIWFDRALKSTDEVRPWLVAMAKAARA